MITLAGGMQEGDFTNPVAVYLEQLTLEQRVNTLPEIVDITPDVETGYLYFTYFDEDGNFPLTAQALIDQETLDFQPQSMDFSNQVIFVSNETFILGSWNDGSVTVTISDNNIDFVEETVYMVSNDDTGVVVNNTSISNYPNPFNPETTIAFNIEKPASVNISIYNIKGQKVTSLLDELFLKGKHEVVWNGRDANNKPVSSGIYYVQLLTGEDRINHKIVLMK
jgi:hypothetical protein